MEEVIIPIMVVGMLFIGLPWLVFHYVTKWKSQATLTTDDEKMLDELHELARRLDDRMLTIERIMAAENPGWRQLAADPSSLGLDDRSAERSLDRSVFRTEEQSPVRRVGQ
jgi:phage shock protein B